MHVFIILTGESLECISCKLDWPSNEPPPLNHPCYTGDAEQKCIFTEIPGVCLEAALYVRLKSNGE